jgi:hypothetical protein
MTAGGTEDRTAVGFDFVDRRVMGAVQRVASSDPNPADPFRGLYISDETALQLTTKAGRVGTTGRAGYVTLRGRGGGSCRTYACVETILPYGGGGGGEGRVAAAEAVAVPRR